MSTLKPTKKKFNRSSVTAILKSFTVAMFAIGSPISTLDRNISIRPPTFGKKYGQVGPSRNQTIVPSAVNSLALFCDGTNGRGAKLEPFSKCVSVNPIAE